jgi:ABC-type antimicrobial peptide transport system permease subunit
MRLARNVRLSVKALVRHRIRTALALSGMAVGVGAVLVMTAIGEGSEQQVIREIDALGRNLLIVSAANVQRVPWRSRTIAKVNTMVLEDADAVLSGAPDVALVAPVQDGGRRVKYGAMSTVTTVLGTTSDYEEIRDFRVVSGRYFTPEENFNSARVVVLGSRIDELLFPEMEAVGRTLRLGKTSFQVIGVLESKGTTVDGLSEEDNKVLIPIRTALRRVFNVDYINQLYVQVKDGDRLQSAEDQIADVLRTRHRTSEFGLEDDFRIQNQRMILAARLETVTAFQRMSLGLGAVAVLVGGVGILSIMLLAVRERRNEVGLRVAVGARRRDILVQFLVESLLLGAAGGTLGVCIGWMVAWVVGRGTEWETALNSTAIVVGVVSALGIGALSGVYPAQRAAALDPIEALRAE